MQSSSCIVFCFHVVRHSKKTLGLFSTHTYKHAPYSIVHPVPVTHTECHTCVAAMVLLRCVMSLLHCAHLQKTHRTSTSSIIMCNEQTLLRSDITGDAVMTSGFHCGRSCASCWLIFEHRRWLMPRKRNLRTYHRDICFMLSEHAFDETLFFVLGYNIFLSTLRNILYLYKLIFTMFV